VLTEELWNENQKTLVSQWKKELKNLSQPGLATLVQKIEDFLKEFPQKYSDLVWFKEVLNVLLSLSSEYPHTFNQPSHLPVNTADVLFE
jgi:chemotaxis regulatin CheY-phosphate phosphatase CheZ